MNIIDLVVGKPIKTSDERAEQIGPAQGIPIFGLDALSSAAYGPEAALSLLIPAWPARRAVHRSHQRRHHHVARDRVLFLSPDHRRLSFRRRLLYRGALQPWRTGQPACRGRAARRLHPHRRRGHFRGSRRLGLGRSVLAAAHGFSLRRHSDRHHHPQSPRRARCRPGLRGSHLSLCRHASHYHRRGRYPCSPQRRTSHAGGAPSASAAA